MSQRVNEADLELVYGCLRASMCAYVCLRASTCVYVCLCFACLFARLTFWNHSAEAYWHNFDGADWESGRKECLNR